MKYRIGITEAGDAGLDLSWVKKLDTVDGAIVITKHITEGFCKAVLAHQDKLIVHATITGFGGTIVETNVPALTEECHAISSLVYRGFPKERVVIRVDPIIPTEKGIEKALRVIQYFMKMGFARFRVSVIDMYPHVRDRFTKAGLPLPYGPDKFSPSRDQLMAVDAMLREAVEFWNRLEQAYPSSPKQELRIESCAEPGLREPIACGCVSGYDLKLLGLDESDIDTMGVQRRNCLCYSGKTELLNHKHPCSHQCLYCYWKS